MADKPSPLTPSEYRERSIAMAVIFAVCAFVGGVNYYGAHADPKEATKDTALASTFGLFAAGFGIEAVREGWKSRSKPASPGGVHKLA